MAARSLSSSSAPDFTITVTLYANAEYPDCLTIEELGRRSGRKWVSVAGYVEITDDVSVQRGLSDGLR